MKWAALVAWVATAGGGLVLLGIWLHRGGIHEQVLPGHRIRPPLLFGHASLATTGLVFWIVYLASDVKEFAWIGFDMLAVAALLGFYMFAIWLQRRQRRGPAKATDEEKPDAEPPPEQRFPVTIVAAHGVFAAAVLALAALASAGVEF